LTLLGVGPAPPRRKERKRERRTPAKGQAAEDALFAAMPSCIRRLGLKCISGPFDEAADHTALIRHRAKCHEDEPPDQRPLGEPCCVCRRCLEPDPELRGKEKFRQPGDDFNTIVSTN